MNLLKEKCSCGSPLCITWSERHETYMPYNKCWEHIDQYDKELNTLVLHHKFDEVPRLFHDTKLDLIPSGIVTKFTKAVLESGVTPSALFHGTTGKGKSRAAWLIVEDWMMRHYPRKAMCVNARKLETLLIGSYSESVSAHDKNLKMLCKTGLLFIDDLGKERLTPRLESDLFAIIDERMLDQRPTIITTNFNATGLVDRFPTKETGIAFIRRIKESFHVIGTGAESESQ